MKCCLSHFENSGEWCMMRLLVVTALLILWCCGCNNAATNSLISADAEQTQQIKQTIMLYNQLLREGYQSFNMNPLQQAATKRQAETLYIHMSALGEGRVRMESSLKDIQFTEVNIQQESKATVKTKEVWDFRHTDIDKKQVVLDEKGFEYLITYELVKEGPRWLVDKVVAKEGGNQNRSKTDKPTQGRFTTMLKEKYKKSSFRGKEQ